VSSNRASRHIARAGRSRIGVAILGRGHREHVVGTVIVVHCQPDLLEVIGTLNATGGFARGLNGGQKQRDQHGDDRDDDQQFDQSEA
jgi:hypothetical protein